MKTLLIAILFLTCEAFSQGTIPQRHRGAAAGGVVYTDDFTGDAGDLASPWTNERGTTNPMRRNGTGAATVTTINSDCLTRYSGTTPAFSADQYSEVVIGFTGPGNDTKYIYLMVRASGVVGAGSYYIFWSDGGSSTVVRRYINGGTNIKTDNTFTYASGDTLRLSVVGDSLKVYKNGTVWSGLTCADANIATGDPGFGLYVPATTDTVLSWKGGNN